MVLLRMALQVNGPSSQELPPKLTNYCSPLRTGRDAPIDIERSLFALPARQGGLNIGNPASLADEQYTSPQQVTKPPLVDLIASQNKNYPYEVLVQQIKTKNKIKVKGEVQD